MKHWRIPTLWCYLNQDLDGEVQPEQEHEDLNGGCPEVAGCCEACEYRVDAKCCDLHWEVRTEDVDVFALATALNRNLSYWVNKLHSCNRLQSESV
jgi:hypothetical protein